jgi:hypothetical protein
MPAIRPSLNAPTVDQSSCSRRDVRPSDGLVVAALVVQAPPHATGELVREVAKSSVMRLTCSTASVVVGTRTGTLRECGEGPPMTGIRKSPVANMTSGNRAISTRRPSDRCGAGEGSQASGRTESVANHPRARPRHGRREWGRGPASRRGCRAEGVRQTLHAAPTRDERWPVA